MAGFAAMAGDDMAWKMICRCFTGSLARPAWLSSNDSICIRTWRGGLTGTTWGAAIGTVARFRRKLEATCVLLFWAESPSWGLFRACQIHLNTIVRTTHCSMFSKRIKQNQENKRWFFVQHCTLHVVERLQRTNHPHVTHVCVCACVSCVKICWDFNHHSEVLRDWWAIFCAALPSPPDVTMCWSPSRNPLSSPINPHADVDKSEDLWGRNMAQQLWSSASKHPQSLQRWCTHCHGPIITSNNGPTVKASSPSGRSPMTHFGDDFAMHACFTNNACV